MEFLQTILRKFDKKKCVFYQNKKCILHNSNCIACSWYQTRIEGITENRDYLNYVTTKNNANRAYTISVFALVFSLLTLLIKLVEIVKEK